jgi:hypothetical protein
MNPDFIVTFPVSLLRRHEIELHLRHPRTYCRREELGGMSFLAFIDRAANHF